MYCVLMGDIVSSKEITGEQKVELTNRIRLMLEYINFKYEKDVCVNFTSSRGDFFEGVVYAVDKAVEIARDIVETLLPTEIRISIVLGDLDTINDTYNANLADGEAFHIADKILTKMKTEKSEGWLHLSINIEKYDERVQPLIDSTLSLLDVLSGGWTEKQRECVFLMSHNDNQQKVVAEKLGITSPAVSLHLKAANYVVYKNAFENLGKYLKSILDKKYIEKNFVYWMNLGRGAEDISANREALVYYVKALELAEKEFGKESSLLIEILNSIGNVYINLLDFDNAKKYIEQSSVLAKNSNNALNEAKVLELLGKLYMNKDNEKKALVYYIHASEIYEKVYGKEHLKTVDVYRKIEEL